MFIVADLVSLRLKYLITDTTTEDNSTSISFSKKKISIFQQGFRLSKVMIYLGHTHLITISANGDGDKLGRSF